MNDTINIRDKFRRANVWICLSVAIVVLYAIAREYWGFANEINFAIWAFFLAVLATIIASICGKKVAQPDLITRERFIILVLGLPSFIIASNLLASSKGLQNIGDFAVIYVQIYFAFVVFYLSWGAIRNVYLNGSKIEDIVAMKWLVLIGFVLLGAGALFLFWYYEFKPVGFLIGGFILSVLGAATFIKSIFVK